MERGSAEAIREAFEGLEPIYRATAPLAHIRRGTHGRRGEFIYIIHHADEVLYVGSTVNSVYIRISAHRSGGKRLRGKPWTFGSSEVGTYIKSRPSRALFVTVAEFVDCDLFAIEETVIKALQPRMNQFGTQYNFVRSGRFR